MTQNQPLIPLADAISELRAELITSMKQAANQELQFRLKPVELEFQVAVTKSADGNAAHDKVDAGAGRRYSGESNRG
jgi:hypothetical protein